MGQYYFGVIREKNSREVIAAQYACKLHESSRGDLLYMAYAISRNGIGYKQRVCWAGDYSDIKDADGNNLYKRIRIHEDQLTKWVPEVEALSPYDRQFTTDTSRQRAIEKFREFRHKWFQDHIAKNEQGDIRDELRFICNHDRKEYFDINDIVPEKYGFDNPLAVLTSDPTCRISGGGDYRYQDNYRMYAAWYDCILSSEQYVPEGYNKINPNFYTTTPIWDYSGIRERLYANEGNIPYPNYGDFHSFLTHGRFNDFQERLCVLPEPEMRVLYGRWYQTLDFERVFKAFDTMKRVLKDDSTLSKYHINVTFRHDKEYDLHYLECNGVSICIYQEDNEDTWRMLRPRAEYKDVQYDCDRKSRAYHRCRLQVISTEWMAA